MSAISMNQSSTEQRDNGFHDRYEVVRGRYVELPPMGYFESGVASILAQYLGMFARERALGRVRVETLFRLKEDLELRPDLAFVSHGRWPRRKRLPHVNACPVVPDLAVEVVSPSNTADEVQDKLHEYFSAGVLQVWVIYPRQHEVYVYTSPTDIRVLTLAQELDGGNVVPGFRLPLATLFEDDLVEEE